MQITIPKEMEAIIRSRAKFSGFEKVEDYVLSVLIADSAPQTAAKMPYDQWHREFFSQVESFQPGNPNFDDSRESIYPVR